MTEPYAPLLDRGVQLRIQAKVLEEEAKAMKDEAKQFFDAALTMSGEKKLTHEDGTITRVLTTRTNLNKEKLANVLVSKGVMVDVVKSAMDEATTSKESESISFRESKKKGE